jgi:hypothetical protein
MTPYEWLRKADYDQYMLRALLSSKIISNK